MSQALAILPCDGLGLSEFACDAHESQHFQNRYASLVRSLLGLLLNGYLKQGWSRKSHVGVPAFLHQQPVLPTELHFHNSYRDEQAQHHQASTRIPYAGSMLNVSGKPSWRAAYCALNTFSLASARGSVAT